MNLMDYNVPFYYNSPEVFDGYYISRDRWLLECFNKHLNSNYYSVGNGYGLSHRYDFSLIFTI